MGKDIIETGSFRSDDPITDFLGLGQETDGPNLHLSGIYVGVYLWNHTVS